MVHGVLTVTGADQDEWWRMFKTTRTDDATGAIFPEKCFGFNSKKFPFFAGFLIHSELNIWRILIIVNMGNRHGSATASQSVIILIIISRDYLLYTGTRKVSPSSCTPTTRKPMCILASIGLVSGTRSNGFFLILIPTKFMSQQN